MLLLVPIAINTYLKVDKMLYIEYKICDDAKVATFWLEDMANCLHSFFYQRRCVGFFFHVLNCQKESDYDL